MTPKGTVTPFLITLFMLLRHVSSGSDPVKIPTTYIIHVEKEKETSDSPTNFMDHIRSVSDSAPLLYAYRNLFHGFSTRMTKSEADLLSARPGILSVIPESKYELHTTRSPQFLGLQSFPLLSFSRASDTVIGILDSGIWPESRSFSDEGMPDIPARWKGACELGNGSGCNRKVIGARFFAKGYEAAIGRIDERKEERSARDGGGHGSHTASTAAGKRVDGANLFGYAEGTARGMADMARIAVYKVCWKQGCFNSDIAAGMDAAAEDGVDIMSMSLGGPVTEFYRDTIAIGSFSAISKGIFVACSAGNSGPGARTLSNLAPWITTIGAGTLDRNFPAFATFNTGNRSSDEDDDNNRFSGISIYNGGPIPSLPAVYAGNSSNGSSGNLCLRGDLIPEKVKGKVVVCDRGGSRVMKGLAVKAAGGSAMILANTEDQGEDLVADSHLCPTIAVGYRTGQRLKKYIFSNPNPRANLDFTGTRLGIKPSPVVAAFSSRGPNVVVPEILKPDLIAPGVNILAAWAGGTGPTGLSSDPRRVDYNIISGTSMSCPHVSGLTALIKTVHPGWTPAAIRSALMTTAYTVRSGNRIGDAASSSPADPFDYGNGHVDSVSALDPGLVYDIDVRDYSDLLCALNYTEVQIRTITGGRTPGCDSSRMYRVTDLNYPSFAVTLGKDSVYVMHKRTLKNVGVPAVYKVSVSPEIQTAVKITVEPGILNFSETNESKSYTVGFSAAGDTNFSGKNRFGSLEWFDGKHVVRSQIAVSWKRDEDR